MKNNLLKKIYYTLASVLFVILFSIQTQAHFGSKGPFGGTITCSITAADTVFMGTTEGGVYASTSPLLVGWRARPVGLKSGKITALAHNGANLFVATADSGIFILNGYVDSDRYFKKNKYRSNKFKCYKFDCHQCYNLDGGYNKRFIFDC